MSWNTSQLAEKNVTFCTPGTQSVHKWTFLGVPSDAENRVDNELRSAEFTDGMGWMDGMDGTEYQKCPSIFFII